MVPIGDKVVSPCHIVHITDHTTHCLVTLGTIVITSMQTLDDLHTILQPYTAFRRHKDYLINERHIEAEDDIAIYTTAGVLCK